MTGHAGFLDTGDNLLRLTSATCSLDASGALDVPGSVPEVVVGIHGMRFSSGDYADFVDQSARYDGMDADDHVGPLACELSMSCLADADPT